MKTLMELQNHYQFKTDKQVHHYYLSVYDQWFSNYKYSSGNFLELGVAEGGSLNLWSLYFPRMNIVGVDMSVYGSDVYGNPPNKAPQLPHNTTVFQMKMYTQDCVNSLKSKFSSFDIIIDDGSHFLNDQQFVLEHYSPLISSGLLIIEDIPRSNNIPLLQSCYALLGHRKLQITLHDNNNARRIPPNRSQIVNYGYAPAEMNPSDDSLLIIEFFE